jgi:hypothetical protein
MLQEFCLVGGLIGLWNALQTGEFIWRENLTQFHSVCAGLLWASGARMVLCWYTSNRMNHLVFGLRFFGLLLRGQILLLSTMFSCSRWIAKAIRRVRVRVPAVEFTCRFLVTGSREANFIQDVTGGLQPQNSCCGPPCWHGKFVKLLN